MGKVLIASTSLGKYYVYVDEEEFILLFIKNNPIKNLNKKLIELICRT